MILYSPNVRGFLLSNWRFKPYIGTYSWELNKGVSVSQTAEIYVMFSFTPLRDGFILCVESAPSAYLDFTYSNQTRKLYMTVGCGGALLSDTISSRISFAVVSHATPAPVGFCEKKTYV